MPNSVFNGFEINNNVYAANSSFSIGDNHLVWLDKPKGAFYSLNGRVITHVLRYISNPDFDPNDWEVKQLLAAQVLKMAHWPLSYLKTIIVEIMLFTL